MPMKIENVRVYGLEESIVASGYPMQTWVSQQMQKPNEKDANRAKRLGNTPIGSGHNNYLKGIVVQFDLTCTIKMWTQAQRYHWFDFVSSCATMHKLKDMDLDRAYEPYVDERMIMLMKDLQQKYKDNPTGENFLKLIYSNPVGMRLTARMTTNYQQLKTIYAQRYTHRLPEWREFCEWIAILPHSKELGVCGDVA